MQSVVAARSEGGVSVVLRKNGQDGREENVP